MEEDIEQLAEEESNEGWKYQMKDSQIEFAKSLYIKGYKAASTNKWTDEDMKLMFQLGREFELSNSMEDSFDAAYEALQSISSNTRGK